MIDIFCTLKKKELNPSNFLHESCNGLAINEVDREEKAIEFYNVLSNFDL